MQTIIKEIKRGVLRPIYVLYGTETYRMERFVLFLMEQIENKDLAVMKFDTSDTPIEYIVSEAETTPFLVPRKYILINDSYIFSAGKGGKVEHQVTQLLRYMDQPLETSIMIFFVPTQKLDERKKVVKKVHTTGVVLPFLPFHASELLLWVRQEVETYQCNISDEVIHMLIRHAGTNLQFLANEVEKCCLYTAAGGTITVETVTHLIVKNTEQNVFHLVNHIIKRQVNPALQLLHELIKQKEEPFKILALIVRQLRLIIQVKELMNQGCSQQQIATQLKVHPYAVKVAYEQAQNDHIKKLTSWLAEAAELDYKIKSGEIGKVFGLEIFIMWMAAKIEKGSRIG